MAIKDKEKAKMSITVLFYKCLRDPSRLLHVSVVDRILGGRLRELLTRNFKI